MRQKIAEGALPGFRAQRRLAPVDVAARLQIPEHARQAAVLMLLYPHEGCWTLAFIRRAGGHPEDRHAGQIAFPGGRVEETDPDLCFTAVREATEEIGIDPFSLHHLGALSSLYIPVSNYEVHPFLAWMDHRPDFRLQPSEVAGLLEPAVEVLARPETLKYRSIRLYSGKWLSNVPCFEWDKHVIWGATAMMLSELLALIGESTVE